MMTDDEKVVVLIDDSRAQRNLLSGMLRETGLHVLDFETAEDALQAMQTETRTDLVVTDLFMPGIDGWRFCRLLRSPEYRSFNQTPILAVSSTFTGLEAARISTQAGASAFLGLPHDLHLFEKTVQSMLRGELPASLPRVLVVDDSRSLALLLQEVLIAADYQADIALTAADASTMFEAQVYDAAVIDYHLPDSHGGRLLADFLKKRPGCACLIMSGDTRPEMALECLKQGAAACLRKPFSTSNLIDVCAKAIREQALLQVEQRLEQRTRELRQSQESYGEILENAPVGIFQTTPEGRFISINPEYARLAGYADPSEMMAQVKDIVGEMYVHPEQRELYKEQLRRHGQVKDFEAKLKRRDGSPYWVSMDTRVQNDPDGNIFYSGFLTDVTKRKQAEEALQQSEKMYRTIFEGSRDGYVMVAPDGRIIDANRAYCDMLGYSIDELRQMEDFYSITPSSWIEWEEEEIWRKRLLGRGYSGVYEKEYIRKDGSVFPVELQSYAVRDEDGSIQFLWGTARDVTSRKHTRQALTESEKKYREILTAIEDGYYETDLAGNVTFCNQAAARMLGYEIDEFIGLNFRKICRQTFRVFRAFNKVYSSGRPIRSMPVEIVRKDGSTGYGELSVTPLKDHKGLVFGFRGVARDITERKQAEQEREKLQVQLLQAQKMESVGILAGGVAHDFNNLLQAMRGNIELLLHGKTEDHPDAVRLSTVTRSMDRAAQLVRQLLLFGRKSGARRVRVDLNREVEDAARMLQRTIPRMIALELRLDPSIWALFVDPVQIEQVLLNLASNASDAMPEGGKLTMETNNVVLDEAFVRAHPGSTAGPHVLLTVTDTGCGMDREVLDHVFDPFFTTKEVGQGTGLGLASVYGIVKSHGGYIQCSSEPGLGTKFRVYWPAVDLKEVCPDVEPQKALPPQGQGGSETVLVVDDEQDVLELTREALESHGYAVQCAASGEEALDIYRDRGQTIDLVLLDLSMPGMGGGKCLQELLQIDPEVRVIIISGHPVDGRTREITKMASGFIGKPYRLQELAAAVREALP